MSITKCNIIVTAIMLNMAPTAVFSASGGSQLNAWCDASKLTSAAGRRDHRHLMGYIQGSTDALIAHREACPPDSATVGHGVELVCDYVATHRHEWNSTKFSLAKSALSNAFPCSRQN